MSINIPATLPLWMRIDGLGIKDLDKNRRPRLGPAKKWFRHTLFSAHPFLHPAPARQRLIEGRIASRLGRKLA
jgi:hypothetical protein